MISRSLLLGVMFEFIYISNDILVNVPEKYTPHPFKPFRDYLKSPSYLKEGSLSLELKRGGHAQVQTEMVSYRLAVPVLKKKT